MQHREYALNFNIASKRSIKGHILLFLTAYFDFSINQLYFSGTRRFDGLKIAIKQVPKTKVKRWGRVQGRMVPIEFELLDKVSDGHKGIVQMIDWYERRSR